MNTATELSLHQKRETYALIKKMILVERKRVATAIYGVAEDCMKIKEPIDGGKLYEILRDLMSDIEDEAT